MITMFIMKNIEIYMIINMIYYFYSKDNIVQLLGEEGVIWMYLSQADWILRSYSIQCLGNICLR